MVLEIRLVGVLIFLAVGDVVAIERIVGPRLPFQLRRSDRRARRQVDVGNDDLDRGDAGFRLLGFRVDTLLPFLQIVGKDKEGAAGKNGGDGDDDNDCDTH